MPIVNLENVDVHENIQDSCVTLYIMDPPYLASASMSHVMEDLWYFNRLYVHPKLRNRGYAKLMLGRLSSICAEEGYTLLCHVNPYGELNYEKLVELYTRYGFKVLQN